MAQDKRQPDFGKPDFDGIGMRLLQKDERCHVIEAGGERLICIAHHDLCTRVLRDDVTYSLAPYDETFRQLDQDRNLEAILGANSPGRDIRVSMLRDAASHLVEHHISSKPHSQTRPQDDLGSWIEEITRENCETLLGILQAIHCQNGKQTNFNVIREYVWPVANMSVQQIVGVRAAEALSWQNRVLLLVRNLRSLFDRNDPWFTPEGDLAAASNLHFEMLTLAGQIAASGSGQDKALSVLAGHSLRRFLAGHGRQRSLITEYSPRTLGQVFYDPKFRLDVYANEAWKAGGFGPSDYDAFARNTLLELMIAMGGLMPLAFSKSLQFVFGPQLAASGCDLNTFTAAMGDPKRCDNAIAEALRLNPPIARVFRTVTQPVTLAGEELRQGDRLAMLTKSASADPQAFPDPSKFRLDRGKNYLDFGYSQSAHSCFGEQIAKTIFRVLFMQLVEVAEPVGCQDEDGLKMLGGAMPDHMPFKFCQEEERS